MYKPSEGIKFKYFLKNHTQSQKGPFLLNKILFFLDFFNKKNKNKNIFSYFFGFLTSTNKRFLSFSHKCYWLESCTSFFVEFKMCKIA